MPETLAKFAYQDMLKRLAQQNKLFRTSLVRSERSEVSGGMNSSLFADRPLAGFGVTSGDLLFISDGRKSGEGAGLGTGVPCYYNALTDSWLRLSDDTTVAI